MSITYVRLCRVAVVATLVGKIEVCMHVVRDCSMKIEGRTLVPNLVVLQMQRFDVIFQMDWLPKHY
jgi:hypothetical protein